MYSWKCISFICQIEIFQNWNSNQNEHQDEDEQKRSKRIT